MRRIIFKKRGCIYRWYNQHIKGGRVWRYQMGNQNPYIEEEQTAQWQKEKSTKRTNNDLHIKGGKSHRKEDIDSYWLLIV